MGASISTTSSEQIQEVLNTAITNAIMSTAQTCSTQQNVSQNVTFDIQGSKTGDINILAKQTADIGCIQGSANEATLQKNIQTALQSAVNQQAEAGQTFFGMSVSATDSKQHQNIINNISNNVKIENIKKAVAQQTGQQVVSGKIVDSVTKDINISIQGDIVLKAVQNDNNIVNDVSQLSNSLVTQSQQTASSGLNVTMIIAAVLFLCLLCSVGCFFWSKSSTN